MKGLEDKILIPKGEAPSDEQVALTYADAFAITDKEDFTPVRFELNSWDGAEPQDWGKGAKIECVLAGSKKLFQRGIIVMRINDGKPFFFKLDGLLTAIYRTYKTANPYKNSEYKFDIKEGL